MTRMYSVDPHKPSATVHFDWLTAVIPVPENLYSNFGLTNKIWVMNTLRDLGLQMTFMPMSHGLYLYPEAMSSADASIIVAWSEAPTDATFMIQMSGAGVESAESVLRVNIGQVIAGFIRDVTERFNGTFSRVDACCNFFNYGKNYSARYVGEEALAGHLVTRASRIRLVRSASARGGSDDLDAYTGTSEGYTTYVGSNPKQLRVYNKLAERSDKINQRYQVDDWSRWEFQLNGSQAQLFIDEYILSDYDLPQTWTNWLASNYRWIEVVGHQVERSRYPNASWYDEIISGANKIIKLREEKQMPTLEREERWINRQVMPTISNMYYARYKKYLQNGLSDQDAKRLAFKFLERDIDARVVNDELDFSIIDTWIQEHDDRGR